MKSEKARLYFIKNNSPEISDDNISDRLETLVLFRDKKFDAKKLMEDISKIVDWSEVNHIQNIIELDKEPERAQIILNIHSWAKKTFNTSLNNGNIEKLIISYMLGNFLFLEPEIDFQWQNHTKNIEKKLQELFTKLKIEIMLSERAGYSDRKYYNDYRKSLTSGSLKEIFSFMSAIEYGRGYDHYFENFIIALTNICNKINQNLITEIVGELDPILIRMIFKALKPCQVINVLKEYNKPLVLPLMIALFHIVNPTWNNQYSNSLEDDYTFIKNASEIVKKISERIDTENLYKYITECSNIFGNKLWQSIYITFAIQNPFFLDSYISNIDFSLGFGAENVFKTFCHIESEETNLDQFSIKLYHNYFEYLSKERGYVKNYCGTNYLEFLIRAVYVKSEKSHLKYGEMLKEASIDFERALYSWDTKQISMYFTRLIVWVLALSFFLIVLLKIKLIYHILSIFFQMKNIWMLLIP